MIARDGEIKHSEKAKLYGIIFQNGELLASKKGH
jgi:hypothetical protein